MKAAFQLTTTLSATPQELYAAWLDSHAHGNMTGGEAECSAEVGGSFSAWDGYISGTNVSLTPNTEIVQQWRTTEFTDSDADSLLTIRLKEIPEGCQLTLIHTEIPEGQPDYEQGWEEHYFSPMRAYFGGR
jgi:activator of HSP90 ATPase